MILYQNSEGMSDKIAAIGCFFKSCVAVAELDLGKYLTAEQHNKLWDACVKYDYIVNDCIKNSAKIIQKTYALLGQPKVVVEIGNTSEGFYNWVKQYKKYQKICARIEKIKQGGKEGTHFRILDEKGSVIFDPHLPAIRKINSFYTIWYYIE